MQFTTIHSLHDIFGTSEFSFTINSSSESDHGNVLLNITVWSPTVVPYDVLINEPANRGWLELKPIIGNTCSAKIKFSERYERYSLVPLEVIDDNASTECTTTAPIMYTTTLTSAHSLPFPTGEVIKVDCAVHSTDVIRSSMVISSGEYGTFRVYVPSAIDPSTIHGHSISIMIKRSTKKSRIVLISIDEPLTNSYADVLLNTTPQPRDVVAETTYNTTPVIQAPVEEPLVVAGSKWTSATGTTETVLRTDPIKGTTLITMDTGTYLTLPDFYDKYTMAASTNWPNPAHEQGTLAIHRLSDSICIAYSHMNDIEDYSPLSFTDISEYMYENQLPF